MVNDNSTGQDSRRAFHLSTPNSLNSSSPLLSPSSRNEECFRKQNRFVPMERPNPSSSHSPASSSSFEVARTQQIAVPTTFVQADTSSFRELVQKLTGISDDSQEKFPITMPARYANRGGGGGGGGVSGKQHATQAEGGVGVAGVGLYFKQGPDISKPGVEVGPRKSAFKLHERRQSMRKLEIKLGLTSLRHNPSSGLSPRTSGELRSPNLQDIPALVPSPVTPLGSDPFENGYSPSSVITTPTSCNAAYGPPTPTSESPSSAISEEERAIAEKGFYLHPSPLNTPRGSEPELLPLFPLQSPRQSSS